MAARTLVGLLVAGVLAVGVAGCGANAETLDRAATERDVGRAVAKVVTPPIHDTTCVGALPLEAGTTFTCKVELTGGAGTMRVTVRETDDEGALSVEPLDAVMSDAQIAEQLKTQLDGTFNRSFQANCGDGGQQVRRPGSRSTCIARDRTTRRKVAVTVEDASGTLSFKIQGAA